MNEQYSVLLRQLGRTTRVMYAAFEAEVGCALSRWRVLQTLYTHATASQKELATRLEIDPGALTRQLKILETEGLIRRERAAEDNRLSDVELTPAGERLIAGLQPQRRAFLRRALRDLPPDQLDTTLSVLQTLETRLQTIGEEARSRRQGAGD